MQPKIRSSPTSMAHWMHCCCASRPTCTLLSCGCLQPLSLRSAGTTTRLKHTKLLTGLPAQHRTGQDSTAQHKMRQHSRVSNASPAICGVNPECRKQLRQHGQDAAAVQQQQQLVYHGLINHRQLLAPKHKHCCTPDCRHQL